MSYTAFDRVQEAYYIVIEAFEVHCGSDSQHCTAAAFDHALDALLALEQQLED